VRRLALLLLLGTLTGCRVDATVTTRVHGRSGEVTARFALDREAVDVLGGRVGQGAQVTDLRRAGWSIGSPRRTNSGGAVVEISKRFRRPEDLARVMAELSGREGPLRDFKLDRRRSFSRVHYRLEGVVDLAAGAGRATGIANAPDLPERLREAGIDPHRLAELLASRAAEGFDLEVVVDLPGQERANTPDRRRGNPLWRAPLGQRLEISASSSVADRFRPALLVLAALLALGAAGFAVTGRRSSSDRRVPPDIDDVNMTM
jgi:hypothetical protein